MQRIGFSLKLALIICFASVAMTGCAANREARKKAELEALQKKFEWWPTDAKPSPVKTSSAEDTGGGRQSRERSSPGETCG